MIRGVVFDLDGVIVDSPKIYFKVMKNFLKKHSLRVSDAEISNLICHSLREELELIKKKHSLDISHDEFVRETLDESLRISEKELKLNIGVKELLSDLEKNGFLIALASNNNRRSIDFMLNRFGVAGFFSVVVCAEDVSRGKPSPEIYQKAVKKLGLIPSECVGIEDTFVGMQSVKVAGLKCIAFPNKYATSGSFEEADLVVESLAELSAKKISKM